MADFSTLKARYRSAIQKLLPFGWAWRAEQGSTLDKFLEALAAEPARIEGRGHDFIAEMDPLKTFEMLDNWERLLGLPDECSPDETLTTFDRRVRILQKLTTGGGQSKAFFKFIVQQLGYNSEIFDVLNYRDFRVGTAVAGDSLTNSTDPDGTVNSNGWAFAFQVQAPADTVKKFSVGRSSVGERLVSVENETLECVIRKYAPAHTSVVFSYTG